MTPDDEREQWLAKSREMNRGCGCDKRGGRIYQCSYHEGADDAWEDAFAAGKRAGAEEMAKRAAVVVDMLHDVHPYDSGREPDCAGAIRALAVEEK